MADDGEQVPISGGHLVAKAQPFAGIVGNNSSMNQIRYGQAAKYGEGRGRIGNTRGDVLYDQFAKMLGGYGEDVPDPADVRPALEGARNSGKPSLINVCGSTPTSTRPEPSTRPCTSERGNLHG
jgi:thiamine pyrophosphate-dependent acetolactate synthase large subunit-like protein